MIVLIAGMPRSGSTFSFNVARELLEARGGVYQEAFPNVRQVLERATDAKHTIVKTHFTDDETIRMVHDGTVVAICTVRKPEDAIASWMETFGYKLDESIEHLRGWLSMFDQLRGHAHVIKYEQIDSHPEGVADAIAHRVCPDASLSETTGIARRYSKKAVHERFAELPKDLETVEDIGFSHYDRQTFFHRRHVSSIETRPAALRIGSDAVQTIRQSLRPHIDDQGNISTD